jgi:acid stress-induced BolA-like protein IbaG/YrbA
MVLATVQEQIANDELHALSIKKACTPEEWQAQQG